MGHDEGIVAVTNTIRLSAGAGSEGRREQRDRDFPRNTVHWAYSCCVIASIRSSVLLILRLRIFLRSSPGFQKGSIFLFFPWIALSFSRPTAPEPGTLASIG